MSDDSAQQRSQTPQNIRNSEGIRGNICVLPSVICSHIVADRIAAELANAVSVPHDHGCAQLGADNDQTKNTLVSIGKNPNVQGVVVVGLGCEEVQSTEIAQELENSGIPVRELSIQAVGGTAECITEGIKLANDLKTENKIAQNGEIDIGDLKVGIISSDFTESTLTKAEPLVMKLAERVISHGGTILLGGRERFVAHENDFSDRCSSDALPELQKLVDRYKAKIPQEIRVFREATESSSEEIFKILGKNKIDQVIRYGHQAPDQPGLYFVDTSSRVEEAMTGLVSAGAHLIIHITSDGIPTGHPVVPVLKVTGNPTIYEAMSDDLDVDAYNQTPADLENLIQAVCGGKLTRAEEHGLVSFAIERVGPSM